MEFDSLITNFNDLIVNLKDDFLGFVPKLLISLVVLGLGYLLGRLVKFLIIRSIGYLNKLINQWYKSSTTYLNLEQSAKFIGSIFFWLIFLSSFILISDILGLTLVTDWMRSLLQYSPNLLAAIFIVIIAIFSGRILAGIITSLSKRVGLTYGSSLGKIVQYLILVTAIIIAIDQVGIEIAFLITIINIILAALLFGAALAFGLGARTVVSNILAAYYVRKMYKIGDHIRIGDIQGRIARIEATIVLLDTEDGQVVIPAKEFNESKSFLLKKQTNHENRSDTNREFYCLTYCRGGTHH